MIKGYKSKLMDIYENTRHNEKLELQKRRNEIKQTLPEVLSYEKEIGKLSLKLSILALRNSDESKFNDLKDKIQCLVKKKENLLVANNYPKNFLELHYKCPKCKDTGYIGLQKCSCYKKNLIKIYYKNSHMEDALKENNFSKFDLNLFSSIRNENNSMSPRENMQWIRTQLEQHYLKDFHLHNKNLFFYGKPGTGKTFITYCISKYLLDNGFFVVYRTADELMQNLKDIRFNNNSELEDLLINCDLLVIDDLGSEQITDFSTTELFSILNKKLLLKKKMIISTNLNVEELSQYYAERIMSRIIGNFTPFKTYGVDIRKTKKIKK
ncbi:DNA replication protein DnaC [Clostridium perfringens]|uniref:ATP-binding protein n=1 Tax=Clostridium perfringens TaxID=1502 RepID=UPI00103D62AF|nr:ATP-binding protein [Clostridium perfringens]TBX14677.1 DNA replication protein DnaC [Clostridium perfringens]